MYDDGKIGGGSPEVHPDVELAQRLEEEHNHAATTADRLEFEAASFRRKQQMCEAALSQIKTQPTQSGNVGAVPGTGVTYS